MDDDEFDFWKLPNDNDLELSQKNSFNTQAALVTIKRESEKEISLSEIKSLSDVLIVESDLDMKTAISMNLQVRRIKNHIDKTRKFLIQPHLEFQKSVNDGAKSIEIVLNHVEESLKLKINNYIRSKDSSENIVNSNKICSEDGSAKIVKKLSWEITDLSLVPRQYLSVDEKKVNQAIDFGLINIPGIKVIETEEIQMKTKKQVKK